MPLDSLPIQIRNISGNQVRGRGSAANKDQSPTKVKQEIESTQTQAPETTSPHNMSRYATVSDHVQDEEEELFGRYVAAAMRKLSSKSKSLAKMRIQKVLFNLEQSDRASPEVKTEKGSEPDPVQQEEA